MYSASPYSHDPFATAPATNAGFLASSQVVTASGGVASVRAAYNVTGQGLTLSQGNESVRVTYRVLGTAMTTTQGLVRVDAAYRVTGNVVTTQIGVINTLFGAIIYPVGNLITVTGAPLTPEVRYTLTGLTLLQFSLGKEYIWSPVNDSVGTIWIPVIGD